MTNTKDRATNARKSDWPFELTLLVRAGEAANPTVRLANPRDVSTADDICHDVWCQIDPYFTVGCPACQSAGGGCEC